MNYSEKIFKGSAIVFAAALTAAVMSYLLRLFLARNLSVAEFGLLYSILAFVGIFGIFKDIGLGQTLVKFLAEFTGSGKNEQIRSSVVSIAAIQMAAALAFMVPIILFSDIIAINYFKMPGAAFPLQLIAISFIAGTAMTLLQHTAQGLGHIAIFAIVEPVRVAVTLAVSATLIYMGVTGVSYAYVFAAIVSAAFLASALKRKGTITGRTTFEKKLVKNMIKFALPLFVGGLSSLLLLYTDVITLTIFRGVADVGLYNAALPTSQLLWIIVIALAAVLLPVISEMWARKEKGQISMAVSLAAKFSFVALIPLAMMMVAFSEDIVRLLFGEVYISASAALQILAINSLFYTIFVIFSTSLISISMPLINTKITAVISIINLALNVLLIPQYGIVAAAFTTTVSYFIGMALAYVALRKTVQVHLDVASLTKATVGGIISLIIIFTIKTLLSFSIWAEATVALIAGLSFYFVFVLRSRSVTKKELEFMKRLNMPVPNIIIKIVARLSS